MRACNKRLTILSDIEKSALYDLPKFTDVEREEFLMLTELEQALVFTRSDQSHQLYCALQIGYFKAKQAFFNFTWQEVDKEDVAFVLNLYFDKQNIKRKPVHEYEYYAQRKLIAQLFDYRLWSKQYISSLSNQIKGMTKRDITPNFILMEILTFLKKKRIIRPGYTTLQTIISDSLNAERKRLATIIKKALSKEEKELLRNLLIQEKSLSDLAALKQDPKDFKLRMMEAERQKLETIKPLYKIAKTLLPTLHLSKQNVLYYANLVNYYTIYDLRKKIKTEQTYLYLLCYIWQRYQQFNDNLIDAFCYHLKQFEDETKESAKEQLFQYQKKEQHEKPIVGRLLQFLVDDDYHDDTHLGTVRKQAFVMMPKDEIRHIVMRLCKKDINEMVFRWEFIDKLAHRFKNHLRPLVTALDFSSTVEDSPWLAAIDWLKNTFAKQESLNQRPYNECPPGSIPKRLQSFLVESTDDNQPKLKTDRYEFWIYRQLRKRLNAGELYLEDSVHHRSLNHELASLTLSEKDIQQLDVSALRHPIKQQLDSLFSELDELWLTFNSELKEGKLKHLHYDEKHRTLHLRKSKIEEKDEELQHRFYEQLPLRDITDVIRFVNERCRLLSALTPIQTRYGKQSADEKSLIAAIIAQGMNHGNLNMAEISNIPYSQLQETLQSRIRLSTLEASNDLISNDIASMPIFPYYSIDFAMLYSGVDGQKFEVKSPTTKARHSKKYFGKVRGVVAYTLLSNHIPLRTQLISPHEHESYYTFDIWNNNTSDVMPDVVTGDMHCINKANFGIMHWFGVNLFPRFTDMQAQLKHLYSGKDPATCKDFLINPVGQIDRNLIEEEWPNLQRIIALLSTKEISQSTLIKKLCTYTSPNRTRKALFEYDKLIRSINTLKYLRDPKLQRNSHRSQNRIEQYHQLRGAISSAYGKKQLIGKTDIAIEISNQCGRLIANAIIHYNSVILSKLLRKFEAEGNKKGVEMVKRISPVAWQHIHFLGHYTFDDKNPIDLDVIIAKLASMINQ